MVILWLVVPSLAFRGSSGSSVLLMLRYSSVHRIGESASTARLARLQ